MATFATDTILRAECSQRAFNSSSRNSARRRRRSGDSRKRQRQHKQHNKQQQQQHNKGTREKKKEQRKGEKERYKGDEKEQKGKQRVRLSQASINQRKQYQVNHKTHSVADSDRSGARSIHNTIEERVVEPEQPRPAYLLAIQAALRYLRRMSRH